MQENPPDVTDDDSLGVMGVDNLIRSTTSLINGIYEYFEVNTQGSKTPLSNREAEIARIHQICDNIDYLSEVESEAEKETRQDPVVRAVNSDQESDTIVNGTGDQGRSTMSLETTERNSVEAEENTVNETLYDDDVIFIGSTGPQVIEVVDLSTPDKPLLAQNLKMFNVHSTINLTDEADKTTSDRTPVLMCAICMESSLQNIPTSTKCGHVFCWRCITQALSIARKCPLCNKKLSTTKLTRLYIN